MSESASKAVVVFCASSLGRQPAYVHAAQSLGRALVAAGRPLVYGGGTNGIMGAVSDAVLQAGGQVTGVMPYAMVVAGGEGEQGQGTGEPPRLSDRGGRSKIVVDSMHERKMEMARRSSGFVCLPGGYGTFEEILEAICWEQLGIHEKPIIVLNVLGFFDPLRQLVRRAVQEGFIAPTGEHLVRFVEGPPQHDAHEGFDWGKAAIEALHEWRPQKRAHAYDWTVRRGPNKEHTQGATRQA
ncbi:hypothetical protein B0H21DRAFT_780548 [Amylocystis lapponica]|nr:hypothetical protein B0H21DRAFT_780548 [Amylocystis lapponica]